MANYTFDEIHQQPAMWRKEMGMLLEKKAEVSAFMHKYLTPDTDIVLTGAGTSAFIGDALCPVMRGMWRNVRSVATTDIVTHAEYLLDKERPLLLVSFARSGNSPESVAAVNLANKVCKNVAHVYITCNKSGKLALQAEGKDNILLLLLPEETDDKALAIGPAYIIFPFISMSPVVVITLAAIFLKEKANKWQIAGIVVALAAILLLSIQTGGDDSPVSGWLWIVLAVLVLFAWGIQGFFMKFANNSMDAESIFVWMAISGLLLIPVAWYMNSDPMTAAEYFAQDGVAKASLTCFGIQILNAIGALTLVYAYRYGKAVIVSPMEGLSPMVTVLLSLIILSVIPNPLQIAGICCAAFAMYALSK